MQFVICLEINNCKGPQRLHQPALMKHKEEEGHSQAAASLPAKPTVERTGQGEVVLQESCASSSKTPQGGTGAMKPAKEKESAPPKNAEEKSLERQKQEASHATCQTFLKGSQRNSLQISAPCGKKFVQFWLNSLTPEYTHLLTKA